MSACLSVNSFLRPTPLHTPYQVSLLDVREDLGKEACKELQKGYAPESVAFHPCDVTDGTQLVRHVTSRPSRNPSSIRRTFGSGTHFLGVFLFLFIFTSETWNEVHSNVMPQSLVEMAIGNYTCMFQALYPRRHCII